jgi:uncharacterized membrane protein YkoI
MVRTRLLQLLLLAVLLVSFGATTLPQEQQIRRKDVPAPVLAAFESAYPNVKIKGYSREPENGQILYEIESVEGKIKRDVTYTADGTLVSVEETVELSELPPGVKAALDQRFPGGKILKTEKVMKGDFVGYEFEIRHNGRRTEILFDAEGNETKL